MRVIPWHDMYFGAWALVLPITSVLVIPSIQGTTPGYLFALAVLLPVVNLVVVPYEKILAIYYDLMKFSLVFLILNSLAQLSLAFSGISHANPYVQLVDPLTVDSNILLRRTMFTQSLYLLAAVSTFLYVRHLYSEKWDKMFLSGAVILGFYGVYECVYFLIYGSSGDFLSNRVFDEEHPGSWFQTMTLGPVTLQRLKSLTGEPSMYAFTILPFWIYALHTKRNAVQIFLLISLLMSSATTAVLGICTYLLVRVRYYGLIDKFVLFSGSIIILLLAMGLLGNEFILSTYKQIIEDKATLMSQSGSQRFGAFTASFNFFLGLSFFNQLFGIGFGYIRSTDFFSTLLVNLGIVGFIVTLYIFMYPVVKLGRTHREVGLKASLIVIFVTMMFAKSEFAYLFIWLFLGIAYNEIKKSHSCPN